MGTGSAFELAPPIRCIADLGLELDWKKVNRTNVVDTGRNDLAPCSALARSCRNSRPDEATLAAWRKVVKSIVRLVPVSSTCHHACTAGLSTW